MFARTFRIITTLAILISVYWVYALVMVPRIEPEARAVVEDPTGPSFVDDRLPRQVARLRPYFPEGAWELGTPIVLETPDFALLLKDYKTLEDGRIEIKPCTLVFFPDGRDDDSGTPRAILLRAPEGAILKFEDGSDLARAKLGKLQGGQLVGKVTIEGNLAEDKLPDGTPNPAGRLRIATRDVQLSESRIWTPHPLTFELGPNRGRGRDMQIHLTEVEDVRGSNKKKHRKTIESFQVMREVQLHFEMNNSKGLFGGGETDKKPNEREAPVEIHCQGPFHFDAMNYVATFEDSVDVVRLNPEGPSDQLNAEMLTIHFRRPREKKSDKEDADVKQGGFRVTKVEARGNPVIARSPASEGYARGESLVYDLQSGGLTLSGTNQVSFHYKGLAIEAAGLRYTPGADDTAGEVLAVGEGQLRAVLPGADKKSLVARWKKEFRMRPHEGKHLISMLGEAQVEYDQIGRMTGNEIWFWLIERPKSAAGDKSTAGDKPAVGEPSTDRFTPHTMLVQGNVTIDSPQLVGHTETLKMWFKSRPAAETADGSGLARLTSQPGRNAPPGRTAIDSKPKRRYRADGKLVRMQIGLVGKKATLDAVTMSGNVRLAELGAEQDGEKPLVVMGEELELLDATGDATLRVSGQPARAEARGLTMSGEAIRMDRAKNRLWIDSAGSMTLPAVRSPQGTAAANGEPIRIDWQGGMNFNGKTIEFTRNVIARTAQGRLDTGRLAVTLTHAVDFNRPKMHEKPKVARVDCRGGVVLENRTAEQGQLVSIEKMQARELSIDQQSGAVTASGPGQVSSTRKGSASAGGGVSNGGANGAANGPAAAGGLVPRLADGELAFLRVNFSQGISGNIQRREMTFQGQVRCVYGPVRGWEQELNISGAGELGEKDMLLSSETLTVREMGKASAGSRAIELEARGNARIDGRTFTARGDRMTYAAAKQLFVLEGTGQTDAQLWRETQPGGRRSHAAARKILYWRDKNHIKVEGVRFIGN